MADRRTSLTRHTAHSITSAAAEAIGDLPRPSALGHATGTSRPTPADVEQAAKKLAGIIIAKQVAAREKEKLSRRRGDSERRRKRNAQERSKGRSSTKAVADEGKGEEQRIQNHNNNNNNKRKKKKNKKKKKTKKNKKRKMTKTGEKKGKKKGLGNEKQVEHLVPSTTQLREVERTTDIEGARAQLASAPDPAFYGSSGQAMFSALHSVSRVDRDATASLAQCGQVEPVTAAAATARGGLFSGCSAFGVTMMKNEKVGEERRKSGRGGFSYNDLIFGLKRGRGAEERRHH